MLSGLAYYPLYRWDLTDAPFLDFTSRSAWYGIRLISVLYEGTVSSRFHTPHSGSGWRSRFRQIGINSDKTTHISRPAGVKIAELKGIKEEQIRLAGRWNQEQMIGCYLNSLPREFIRAMAGHPSQAGCFEIRRAGVTPAIRR
jgi:hypothetical protein